MQKKTSFFRTIGVSWIATFLTLSAVFSSLVPKASGEPSTEERFQDLFVTAGYSAAFGAALGAAFLAFEPNPSEKLQYISVGASLGFIGGSLAGTYIIFQPMIGDTSKPSHNQEMLALQNRHDSQGSLLIRPQFDLATRAFNRIEGAYTLLTF